MCSSSSSSSYIIINISTTSRGNRMYVSVHLFITIITTTPNCDALALSSNLSPSKRRYYVACLHTFSGEMSRYIYTSLFMYILVCVYLILMMAHPYVTYFTSSNYTKRCLLRLCAVVGCHFIYSYLLKY